MDAFTITCHACRKTPMNTVEAPCCGAVYCWECVLNVQQCSGCGLAIAPEKCKAATAIERLLKAQREKQGASVKYEAPNGNTTVACPECATQLLYSHVEEHLALCPAVILACPNGCGHEFCRKDIAAHVSTVCPLTTVSCPYGCDTSEKPLTRLALQHHLDENVNVHLQLLAQTVEAQKKVISNLSQKVMPTSASGLKTWLNGCWATWKNEDTRKDFLKNTFPPQRLFTILLFCIGILMLFSLPFLVQVVFLFVCWRKHPKSTPDVTPGARSLFRLQALMALSFLFVLFQFPFWLVVLFVAPVVALMYLSREDIFATLQQVFAAH